VLAGMIQVDHLNRAGEMLFGDVPDPFGAIADNNFLFGAAPAAFSCLEVESFAELLRILDSAGVGCGIGIANGKAFLIPGSLREHTAELGFSGMRWQTIEFAFAAGGFLLHHRHTSAVHLRTASRSRSLSASSAVIITSEVR
jgi:hypothetical protein